MRIIEINTLDNGAHQNQVSSTDIEVPEGWAIIPDEMEIPETFPFVELKVRQGVVTRMTAGVVPPPEPYEPEPSAEEILNAMLGVSE